jgi:hypothetical protein
MTILSGDVIANSAPNFPDRAKPSLGHLQGAASGPETPAIGRVGQNRRWKSAIRPRPRPGAEGNRCSQLLDLF